MNKSSPPNALSKFIPVLHWLPNYQPSWLGRDVLAGVTTAAVVIPQAMAYAVLAGLPVEVGLYASLTPMLVYALFGTSRVLSVSVTSTISLLTFSVLSASVVTQDQAEFILAAGTLAVIVGVLLILASILRLGFLANFISYPVLAGFKAGIGVTILVSQIGKALGFSVPKGGFIETFVRTVQGLSQTNLSAIVVSAIVLAIMILLPRLTSRIPASLIAVTAGIIAAFLLNRSGAGVKLAGDIPVGLPVLNLPKLNMVRDLLPGALGIALMSFTESIAASRAFADRNNSAIDPNQELLALGAANLVGGFFQAYPGGGGTSQTAVNKDSGAKTQIAALATSLTVGATLIFLAPLISLIPQPALAILVIVAAGGLIKIGDFQAIGRYRKLELIWALTAFVGVLVLGTLEGILVAVILSMLMLLHAANHPPAYAVGRKPGTEIFRSLEDFPEDETFPGLLIMRTEGWLNFASMPNAREKLGQLVEKYKPQVVILECSAITDVEYTAFMELLEAEEKLAKNGIQLWLVSLNPEPFRKIRHSKLGQILGDQRMFPNLKVAVSNYLTLYGDFGIN
ncbi:MAG: SulP family inorganic anion transporter [Anaerolineales bacterium]